MYLTNDLRGVEKQKTRGKKQRKGNGKAKKNAVKLKTEKNVASIFALFSFPLGTNLNK